MEEISQENKEKIQEATGKDFSLEDLEAVDAPSFDVTVFEGQRVQIEKAEIQEVADYYKNGSYNPDATDTKKVLEVTTAPIMDVDEEGNKLTVPVTFTQEDGSDKFLQVRHRFNLQEKDGKIVISKHPKASLWAFMRKLGVEKPKEIVGKLVTITSVPSKKPGEEDRRFLDIVVK